jgi:hypothetical protein
MINLAKPNLKKSKSSIIRKTGKSSTKNGYETDPNAIRQPSRKPSK